MTAQQRQDHIHCNAFRRASNNLQHSNNPCQQHTNNQSRHTPTMTAPALSPNVSSTVDLATPCPPTPELMSITPDSQGSDACTIVTSNTSSGIHQPLSNNASRIPATSHPGDIVQDGHVYRCVNIAQ